MKLLIVSSVGGHLNEMLRLVPLFQAHEVVLVVNDAVQLPAYKFRRVYQITHAERDWNVLKNFAEAAAILQRERPDVIISSGAGPAVPVMLIAKYLLNCMTIYIECSAAVTKPSLTGRILHRVVDRFYYQWPSLEPYYPAGNLLQIMFP